MRAPLRRLLLSEYSVLYLSVAYWLLLSLFTPGMASGENLANILSNSLPLLIVATGQTFVLVSGGIDLAVTSVIALSSVCGALVMSADRGVLGHSAWATPTGIAVMLLIGAGLGLLNGAAVSKLKMPAFIVTLTVMMFFSGFAIWLTKSRNIYRLPDSFNEIGKGAWLVAPNALWIALVVAVAAHVVLDRSLFGRWLYAVGMNARTAAVSGVPVAQVILFTYMLSGLSGGVAAVLYTGRLETGSPLLGQRIFLDVIGAAVIGGTSLFGGKGKVLWTAFGVLFITLLDNSLNLMGLSNFMVLTVKGAVILVAALLDTARNRVLERLDA